MGLPKEKVLGPGQHWSADMGTGIGSVLEYSTPEWSRDLSDHAAKDHYGCVILGETENGGTKIDVHDDKSFKLEFAKVAKQCNVDRRSDFALADCIADKAFGGGLPLAYVMRFVSWAR